MKFFFIFFLLWTGENNQYLSPVGDSSVPANPKGDWRLATIILGVLLGISLLVIMIIGIVTVYRGKADNRVASYSRYFPHFVHNNQELTEDVQGGFTYRDV